MPKQGRRPEPAIADDVTGDELDRSVRQQLRTGRLSGSKVQGRWVTIREAIAAMVEAGSNSQRRRRRRAA